jgi:hypothetical protein
MRIDIAAAPALYTLVTVYDRGTALSQPAGRCWAQAETFAQAALDELRRRGFVVEHPVTWLDAWTVTRWDGRTADVRLLAEDAAHAN